MKYLPWPYTGWLLRDMARGPLIFLGCAAAAAFLMPAIGGVPPELAAQWLPYLLEPACFAAILVLNRGMVNKDVSSGYYRIFFSRPVHAGGYYLLRWLLGWLAVMVFASLLTAIAAWKYGASLPVAAYLGHISLQYLVLGGLMFLLSSLFRSDAGPALFICAVAAYYHSAAYPPVWLKLIGWLLPPLNYCHINPNAMYTAHWPALLYGLAAVAAAVAVLHYRYFGEGGRGD